MELERMRSNEQKPKVCTKLFPRHNSDPCTLPKEVLVPSRTVHEPSATVSNPHTLLPNPPIQLPVVSEENLVNMQGNLNSSVSTVRINVPVDIKIGHYSLQKTHSPKFVKLSNFNMKKLVPVSRNEILQLAASNVTANISPFSSPTSNVTFLAKIPIEQISPGDTFKAVKVGNTFQLVPVENHGENNN